jgi:hypothetical protein
MTEAVESPPDIQALKALARTIAARLHEPKAGLVRRAIEIIGPERAQQCLEKTLETEANGGLMTLDGKRRRTPGGTFFYVVRGQCTGREIRKIFGWTKPRQPAPAQPEQPDQEQLPLEQPPSAQAPPKPAPPTKPPPVVPPTWEEAKQLIVQAYKHIAEGKTVKLTLIGRPSQVTEQDTCVVMAMRGKPPGSLPAGLPTPPAQSAITWAVFVATKQWNKVKAALDENREDELIVEGYPMVDPKRGVGVVLASSCTSKAIQRAAREAKQK